MSQRVVSVSQLVRYLKSKLDNDVLIQKIQIEGEISNFTAHRSGHWYFSLKDAQSRISCVMFQTYARTVSFSPKNGDKVTVQCSCSMFESAGTIQLYCTSMKPYGVGDLHVQFELLKQKLSSEGLFDSRHKKKLPAYPMKIGVIVGANTAAREDIMVTLKRRWPVAEVVEFHSLVQGETAHLELIKAVLQADQSGCDVLILARGGGSIEDLWAFNNEHLVRYLFQLNTPLVTGIGHEVDVTLCDYVADVRAATPTAAAETVSPDLSEVMMNLSLNKQRMIQSMEKKLQFASQSVHSLSDRKVLNEPDFLYHRQMMNDALTSQLHSLMTSSLNQALHTRQTILKCTQLMKDVLSQRSYEVDKAVHKMNTLVQMEMQKRSLNLKHTISLLDGYSPLKVLSRGYSIAQVKNETIHSIHQAEIHDQLHLRVTDGTLICTVNEKENFHE